MTCEYENIKGILAACDETNTECPTNDKEDTHHLYKEKNHHHTSRDEEIMMMKKL